MTQNGMIPSAGMKLGFQQRFRMAWEITWPMTAIDLAVLLVGHGVDDFQGETWDSLWAVASFFGVWPWVIRRALRREGVGVVRTAGSGQYAARLWYQESLKVMWLLEWRSTVLLLAGAFVVSGALRLAGGWHHDFSAQNALANGLGLAALDAISNLLFIPLLIPGMLRKRFRGFRLDLAPAKLLERG
jgi:hypothetical protein